LKADIAVKGGSKDVNILTKCISIFTVKFLKTILDFDSHLHRNKFKIHRVWMHDLCDFIIL